MSLIMLSFPVEVTPGNDTPETLRWDVIQIQKVAYLPGDDVIRAGGVAADSQSAHQPLDG